MRLIDIDAMMEHMEECDDHTSAYSTYATGYIKAFAGSAPTIDAVEVVRCKDCKHFHMYTDHKCYMRTGVTQKDYCSKGERREDGRQAMTIHKLKLNAAYYDDSASGIKTFEIRNNDRNFKVGDILELREYVWSNLEKRGAYTGAVHWKVITYILNDKEYLHDGYVCLAVSPIAEPQEVEHE